MKSNKKWKKNIGKLERADWGGFQMYGGTKLEFWTRLGTQLYPSSKNNTDTKSNQMIIG